MQNSARILPFSSRNNRGCRSRRLLPLPDRTDDLSSLIIPGKTVAVCDAENLIFSAHNHGYEIDFRALGQLLSPGNIATELHAAFSRPPGDDALITMFKAAGWQAHARDIIWVPGPQGLEKRANADTLIATLAGLLVAAYRPASLILLTGDGDLASDTARAVHSLVPNPPLISTLAIPGTASSRLDPAQNPLFHARLSLGQDVIVGRAGNLSLQDINPASRPIPQASPADAPEVLPAHVFPNMPKPTSILRRSWTRCARKLFGFTGVSTGAAP